MSLTGRLKGETGVRQHEGAPVSAGRTGRLAAACAATLVLVFVVQNVSMMALGVLRWQGSPSQGPGGAICRAPAPR